MQSATRQLPTLHHSRIQKYLIRAIDNIQSSYKAFPELRCVLSKNSVVPDISIVKQNRIPTDNSPLQGAPDWLIEILSNDQSTTKLITKIQDCVTEGTKLGWLIDSQEEVIMIFLSNQPLQIVRGNQPVIVLDEIDLQITANQVFECLKV